MGESSLPKFLCATKCLKREFGDSIEKVYDFYTDQPGIDESHALVIFKIMSLMKTVSPPNLTCLNCKMLKEQCLDGFVVSSTNFVPEAKVMTPIPGPGINYNIVRLVHIAGTYN